VSSCLLTNGELIKLR